jgi:hypothetical protein
MLRKKSAHVFQMCNRCHFTYLQEIAKTEKRTFRVEVSNRGGFDIYTGTKWEVWFMSLGQHCEC